MGNAHVESVSIVHREDSTHAIFFREWQTYRKMVDYNYLFHREAYDRLHRFLIEYGALSFRFLDVACGDASATVGALLGTQITHYHGIDQSAAALTLAREALAVLDCPVVIEQNDFVAALNDSRDPEHRRRERPPPDLRGCQPRRRGPRVMAAPLGRPATVMARIHR